MSALLECLRLHKPLPPPATEPRNPWKLTAEDLFGYKRRDRITTVEFQGEDFAVCYAEDEHDRETPFRCWAEAIRFGRSWFWFDECHSQGWRDAFDEALTAQIESRRAASPGHVERDPLGLPCAWPGLAKLEPIL